MILFILPIFFFTYCLMNLRIKLRYYILYLLTIRQNVGFIWVTNKNDAQKYLQSTNKGNFIETKLSRNAWKPIFSLESENGETWMILKERLFLLMKQLPSTTVLNDIICQTTNINSTVITSREIGLLTIRIFLQYIFGKFDSEKIEYHDKCCQELYDASLEFRKEIALKGRGNYKKKQIAVDIIRAYLSTSSYNLPDDIYSVSVILQPFIISPAINVSDIAIGWDLKQSVEANIIRNHPFPILEREICINGKPYQVFIPTDELHILPFGYGMRQCSGKAIAAAFLERFFVTLIERNIFKPTENHIYSGRDNDNSDDYDAIIFQIQKMIDLFIQ
jgi:hypothetical protein